MPVETEDWLGVGILSVPLTEYQMDDEPIGTAAPEPRLDASVKDLLWQVVRQVDATSGLKNGGTAFYWHLVTTCQKHAERNCDASGR